MKSEYCNGVLINIINVNLNKVLIKIIVAIKKYAVYNLFDVI